MEPPRPARDDHDRFEALAVEHVLGHLDPDAAAEFRAHLLGCRRCKLRVAELRNLAHDLAAAEREERRRAALRTEVEAPAAVPPRPRRWPLLAAVAVAALVLGGLTFWNLHLRRVVGEVQAVSELRRDLLEAVTAGPRLPVAVRGVEALAARDGDAVVLTVAGVPALSEREVLVLWLVDPDGGVVDREVIPGAAAADGLLALRRRQVVSGAMWITVEEVGRAGETPGERWLVRVDLGT